MPQLFPFEGLVYDLAVSDPLGLVTAPPYDVINDERRAELAASSSHNVVLLDLIEASLTGAARDAAYDRSADLLGRWEAEKTLVRTLPSWFVYEMTFSLDGQDRRVRGVMGALELQDWGRDVIPHEATMSGPVEDRLRLLRATRTHLSPVYGIVEGPCDDLTDLLEKACGEVPSAELTDEQGVTHRMWTVPDDPLYAEVLTGGSAEKSFASQPMLIADGHHRYTTALRYRAEMNQSVGAGPWDRVLTLVVDSSSQRLPVLPFHRIQLGGSAPTPGDPVADADAMFAQVSDDPPIVGLASRTPDGDVAYSVVRLDEGSPAVRALHHGPLYNVAPEQMRYVADRSVALDAVIAGEAVACWFLPPTTGARIKNVVESGERLPQKSTYFWPKPRTGMVMMPLDQPPH